MFTSILRVGPMFIIEIILLATVFIIHQIYNLTSCYLYTLIDASFVIFLIEMFASLQIMKNNPKLRRKYIKNRIQQNKYIFYIRFIWDNLNIIFVVLFLYISLISDAMVLSQEIEFNNNSNQNPECNFAIFSLCIYSHLVRQCHFNYDDKVIMWCLYVVTVFLITIMSIVATKEYYGYCVSLRKNLKLIPELQQLNQTLLDCKIYRITVTTAISEDMERQLGDCSICLNKIIQTDIGEERQEIIKLKCFHHFHKECIEDWLKIKDHCPYRCYLDEV